MTTALEGVRGQRHAPAAIYPRERAGTHCTGGWVGPSAGLNRCGKSRPPPEFDPRTVQPVASRYTNYPTWPTFKNKLYRNSPPSDCHLYSAEVNLGGCRLKHDRWTKVSVKWPWRIAENTDFCEKGVEKHFVSGTLWKYSGVEGLFSVNRTLETNMTQNMCTIKWF